MQTPYTYLIKFTNPETNQISFYYGSKVAKDSDPEQLWKSYFTSSKIISDLIQKFGKDCFEYEVRKIFDSDDVNENVSKAKRLEHRVLKRFNVRQNKEWLNESTNTFGTYYARYKTEEHKKKLGKKGDENVAKRPEVREKISQSKIGKNLSEETKKKMSESRMGITSWNAGKKYTEDQKKNLKSDSRQMSLNENRKLAHEAWTGSSHSEEARKIIGEKNSKFYKENPEKAIERARKTAMNAERNANVAKARTGKKWIVNQNDTVKSVSFEDLQKYLDEGWQKGMKFKH